MKEEKQMSRGQARAERPTGRAKRAEARRVRELKKRLQDPSVSPEEKGRITEELYRDIPILYVEPEDYFPKELRQKYKLGEYAEPQRERTEEDFIESCGGIRADLLPQSLCREEKKEEN